MLTKHKLNVFSFNRLILAKRLAQKNILPLTRRNVERKSNLFSFIKRNENATIHLRDRFVRLTALPILPTKERDIFDNFDNFNNKFLNK